MNCETELLPLLRKKKNTLKNRLMVVYGTALPLPMSMTSYKEGQRLVPLLVK